jgi:regulator of extracellular matrix RemA (YlzA/DUF370 family)
MIAAKSARIAGLLEGARQEADLIDGELEGDGSAATRRVVVSHEEHSLLVVRRPACVLRTAGRRFFFSGGSLAGTLDIS